MPDLSRPTLTYAASEARRAAELIAQSMEPGRYRAGAIAMAEAIAESIEKLVGDAECSEWRDIVKLPSEQWNIFSDLH